MADNPIRDKNPYLLRAMHEWMSDCGHTPHIIVDAQRPGVQVPAAHVKDGKIVLNISLSATQHLILGNDALEFNTRFGGRVYQVHVPVSAVLGIYSRETNEGMVFTEHQQAAPDEGALRAMSVVESGEGEPPPEPDAPPPRPPAPEGAPARARPSLKIVK